MRSFICNVDGLSYPTHFMKSRGSVIRDNFLEYRTKHHCKLQIKQNIYSIDIFPAPVLTQFKVKV